ncbi:hypothetical protein [Streptomyces sp. T028]|uniref:hypothetical protein n=1 Tax=Streptomyces sp. T028 TaxID=3394379 RepID=UPI003A862573
MASTRRLEVITPETGQFLIGDNPALTLSVEGSRTLYGTAFGDARTLVPPTDPRHMLSSGPEAVLLTVPQSFADRLNTVRSTPPTAMSTCTTESGLEPFVERAAQRRPAGGRTT